MKNKKIILLSLLLISCTPAVNTPVTPSTNPTVSALPSSQVSINPVPTQSVTNSVNPGSSSDPVQSITPTSMPTTNPNNRDELLSNDGILQLNSAYIKTPDTAFLVNNNINMKIKMSFDILPSDNQTVTLFDMYDNNISPKKSHFSLSFSQNKLNLKAVNDTKNIDNSVDLPSIVANKAYEINFVKTDKKIDILLNNQNILSVDFDGNDFNDISGTRTLNIGADLAGNNKLTGKVDYVRVENILAYEFKQNILDQNKYNLTPVVLGDYKFVVPVVVDPISTPTPSFSPTPIPSATVAPERNVTDKSGFYSMDLNVYDSSNSQQYLDCQKKIDDAKNKNEPINLDCNDETGLFNSAGFDFGSATPLINNQQGDIRFVTDIFSNDIRRLTISSSGSGPQVNLVDIGTKSFDSINRDFLKNKVDYTNNKKIFSDSNNTSKVIEDHVYAIKTYRYGQAPRYAKVFVEKIVYSDFKVERIKPPTINSQPSFINSSNSILKNDQQYTYYVAAYDGTGSTVPVRLDTVSSSDASTSNIRFNFTLPYNSKGYVIYRSDTDKIYKIGPLLAPAETSIEFIDDGSKGTLTTSVPGSDTTVRSGFKPTNESKPIKVDFRYGFYGSPD